jgi:Ca2+-transporting ATPase
MSTGGATDMPEELTSAQAAQRRLEQGDNIMPEGRHRNWPSILFETLREPMFVLLILAAGAYLLAGDLQEGLFLLVMVLLVLAMTLYQAGRAERALQALRALSAPTARVHRNRQLQRIPASELVTGDLIELSEGDRVPADAALLAPAALWVDESMLTGESVPVAKSGLPDRGPAPGAGGPPAPSEALVFAGTLVVRGGALARVQATGLHTELGRIGRSLQGIRRPRAHSQREIRRLSAWLAVLAAGVSVALVALLSLRGAGLLDALLAGLALSMSLLPEEFPVILTVFPALGAWRLARLRVLTRRLGALENLGATSVLCVDKTGTLTEHRMRLHTLWHDGQRHVCAGHCPLAPAAMELLRGALLASRAGAIDPVDLAVWEAAERWQMWETIPPAGWALQHEYPPGAARPMLARAWLHGTQGTLAVKGAPEALLPLCDLSDQRRSATLEAAAALAGEGLRILAVACMECPDAAFPSEPALGRYRLLGLIALADPLRADIPQAVAACRRAAIRILMITGDHPGTALAIARQAGLAEGALVTGADIGALTGPALSARLSDVSVCARVLPHQKLAIVQALQQQGAVVAMTGDGVNDAPALQAADVGVAMGERGTDVAREAAELTLLDDRFASLVQAIAAGRRIFVNMRAAMTYVAAVHVPIAAMALLPPLLGWPVLLYPPHIVYLQLVIDPACSLAFENEPGGGDLMRRPPRSRTAPLFGARLLGAALLQGLFALVLLAPAYALATVLLPETQARGAGFAALVLCNLALMLANRLQSGERAAGRSNPAFRFLVIAALALLGLALYLPAANDIFRLSAPPPMALVALAGLAAAVFLGLRALQRHGHMARFAGIEP